jgi:hypothetical protein
MAEKLQSCRGTHVSCGRFFISSSGSSGIPSPEAKIFKHYSSLSRVEVYLWTSLNLKVRNLKFRYTVTRGKNIQTLFIAVQGGSIPVDVSQSQGQESQVQVYRHQR